MSDRLYFRQLLSGHDFAKHDGMAAQMVNFAYLIGDTETREAVVVDPAYGVNELADIAEADGMKLVGALATHHHPDHVGGKMMGFSIEGISTLLERQGMKIHVHEDEAFAVQRVTGISDSDMAEHAGGDVLAVGSIDIRFVHTPGHTPGSQCFLVGNRLVSGDTLFLDGCGRTDLPGSDSEAMYDSLQKLASLPDDVVVYPGHRYSVEPYAPLPDIKQSNFVFRPRTKEQWLMMFGVG